MVRNLRALAASDSARSLRRAVNVLLVLFVALSLPGARRLGAQEVTTDSLPGLRMAWAMVRVPGGTVRVPQGDQTMLVDVPAFWIGRAEVPWELYDVFVLRLDLPREKRASVDAVSRPSNPYGAPDRGFGHRGYPVISVTYAAAVAFAAWLSERTGLQYAVASDAQWQRAADLAFPSAPPAQSAAQSAVQSAAKSAAQYSAQYAAHAWFAANAEASTHPLARLAPDALGLFDLLGNAAEWVTGADGTPWLRGGSYRTTVDALAPDLRERQVPSWNATDPQDPKSRWWLSDGPFAGFRLVRIP